MSKLADVIRRTTHIQPAPLGFATAIQKVRPTMLLVGTLRERWSQAADAVSAGADVLLLAGTPNEKDVAQAVAAADGRPCGLQPPQVDADKLSHLRKAGIDFLALGHETSAAALQDEQLGFVMQLAGELSDTELRTHDALPLDALSLEAEAGPLTIQRQMKLLRISGLTRRPLLLTVQADADPQDLRPLRDAGVALVAVDLTERDAIEELRRLRKAIDELPARRSPRRNERPEVTLPRVTSAASEEDDDEEE